MKRLLRASLTAVLFLGLGAAATAETSWRGVTGETRQGPDWLQTEEPALRPYKSLGYGFAAFWNQTIKALAEGNQKLPILGSVEVFRGARRGVVDFTEHAARGIAHSAPRDWRETGAANTVIDDDILLRNAADFVAVGGGARAAGNGLKTSAEIASVVWAGQKVTDHSCINPEARTQRAEARIMRAQERFAQQSSEHALRRAGHTAPQVEDPRWKQAQRNYIGDRADTNSRRSRSGGNLLNLAR